MKKKRNEVISFQGIMPQKLFVFMKLLCVFLFGSLVTVHANVVAQKMKVTVNVEGVSLDVLFEELGKQANCDFLYNQTLVDRKGLVSANARNRSLDDFLNEFLPSLDLSFSFDDNVIIIRETPRIQQQESNIRITGRIIDERKDPLPGVTISIKGTALGTATDVDGNYSLNLPKQENLILIYTFMGMESQEIKYEGQEVINVTMKEDKLVLDEVVKTGYANIKKSSFTGASTQVNREEILKVSPRNVIDVLQVFDPSLRIARNNEMGSDPNTLPEFYIRGKSGLDQVSQLDKLEALETGTASKLALQNNPNVPVFILDGYEVSLEKVYDMDPQRIESITILKDAAATAIYGSRASNGVIVIESIAPQPGKLNISYNFTGSVTAPDLSDYNLMNAREKLETEVLAGVWKFDEVDYHQGYAQRATAVARGIDIDWKSKPLRNEINHSHGIYLQGGADTFRFGIDLRYANNGGVMKGSYRDNLNAGVTLDYRIHKFQIRNNFSYDHAQSQDSPYGSFGDYTKQLPYEEYKDEDGNLYVTLPYTGETNPMYEASLGNFSRSLYDTYTNNLGVDWYINDLFMFKFQFAISNNLSRDKVFTDPLSGEYAVFNSTPFERGELKITDTKSLNWNINSYFVYTNSIGKNHVNVSLGLNVNETKSSNLYSHYRGFPSGALHKVGHAFEVVTKPTGADSKNRLAGIFLTTNYTYNNIYLFDGSLRFDGSSEFGTDKRWATFWSLGAGLNLHNYEFVKQFPVINQLRIRGTYGQTGQVNYPAYAARDTYEVGFDDWYSTGMGALLMAMGNPNLKWQKTNTINLGFDISLFNRLTITSSWYKSRIKDLISDVSIASSSGFTSYKDNMGENENIGIEGTVNFVLPKMGDFDISVYANIAHNKSKLLKLSEAMSAYNDQLNEFYNTNNPTSDHSKPFLRYEVGGSLTGIYGMKSLGINPSDGKEVFLNRNGEVTGIWEASEQSKLGDTEPKAKGAFGFSVRYKRFSLFTSFMYEWGAQAYNQTLVDRVENAKIEKENVDKRVLTQRWQKPGDVVSLKDIEDRTATTFSTSRFVQDFNELKINSISLSYDFNPDLVKKIGLTMLRIQASTNDLGTFSSVKQERGLSYPYARTFNFSLNANF